MYRITFPAPGVSKEPAASAWPVTCSRYRVRVTRWVAALGVVVCGGVMPSSVVAQQPATGPAARQSAGIFHEPKALQKAAALAEKRTGNDDAPNDGFFLESGGMITGAGWISLGPGYRHRVFANRAVVTTSAAMSWRFYNMAQASIDTPEGRPWSVGAGVLYQDALQVNYFGLGHETALDDRSGYRLQSTDIEGHAAMTRGPFTLRGRLGWIPQLAVRTMAGRRPDYPDTHDLFTDDTAPGLDAQPSFAHADLLATYDVRDVPGHPSSGGAYTVSLSHYRDLDLAQYSFRSLQLEAVHYLPLWSSRWVLAGRAWGVFTGTGDGQTVPFYLMPNTGGRSTIRGYRDFRFSGPHMEVFSAESRWALFEHVDAALFVDAGRVASRVADLGFNGLAHATGAGIRFHTSKSTLARLDLAKSNEGWVLTFKMNDPFRRKTLTADLPPTVPFVP